MSDGNFNRALLPSTPYRSGIKMGRQQMKAQAVKAMQVALDATQPALTDEQKEIFRKNFERELRSLP